MMKRTILFLTLALIAPGYCFSQYFQRLQDFDSTYDWGWDIFRRNDGSLFVIGGSEKQPTVPYLSTMTLLSPDGTAILSRRQLNIDSCGIYPGNPGETRRLPDSGYLMPLTIQSSFGGAFRSRAGLARLDANGDTLFVKKYTDTTKDFEGIYPCTITPSKHYLIGGFREQNNVPDSYKGLVICTDSLGDTLWTHIYQEPWGNPSCVNSIIPLPDGRIVIGAMDMRRVTVPGNFYYHNSPWFIITDSLGNILKDTLYNNTYGGGGTIYKDKNGGYIHFGEIELFVNPDPTGIENFPSYIAHLDTNFRVEWITTLPYTDYYGRRACWQVKQLRDSAYLMIGDINSYHAPFDAGWAAKVSRTGALLWTHEYYSDTNHYAYLRDAVEQPDGSIVLVGKSYNDTTPSWHVPIGDIWLVGVDSNGCEMPGCGPDTVGNLTVQDIQPPENGISIYPNPSNGSITVDAQRAGSLTLFSMEGRQIAVYAAPGGKTLLQLPRALAPGIYMAVFKPDTGGAEKVIRLVYQP